MHRFVFGGRRLFHSSFGHSLGGGGGWRDRVLCGELGLRVEDGARVAGWVQNVRVLGKALGFVRLRDHSGETQLVIRDRPELLELAQSLTLESVVEARGTAQAKRDGGEGGECELVVDQLRVLNRSEAPLPVPVTDELVSPGDGDGGAAAAAAAAAADEEARLRHRFLDLRRPSMQRMLRTRAAAARALRAELDGLGFTEVETPTLFRRTGEGAREFLVPTRRPGQFFTLPQSPQQYKQLLMCAGLPRYYQLARCYRDEDGRADRQPEFTQLDLELAFADQADVQDLVERAVARLFADVFGVRLERPFPRLAHADALARFHSDKPDDPSLASGPFRFLWVEAFPLFAADGGGGGADGERQLESEHHPFTAPADLAEFRRLAAELAAAGGARAQTPAAVAARAGLRQLRGLHYDLVLNGVEVGGGSVRIHHRDVQELLFDCLAMGAAEQAEFRHLLDALSYGCPPHAGFALGFDRLLAIAMGYPSVRDVIAFPKTSSGIDLMTDSPSTVNAAHLDLYHITTTQTEQ